MGDRVIHKRRPENAEKQERSELHAFGNARDDDCEREAGKRHLECGKQQIGDLQAESCSKLHAVQTEMVETADHQHVGSKHKRVAEQEPLENHDHK